MGELEKRIRDVRVGLDGAVYLLTDSPAGRVLRVFPKEIDNRGNHNDCLHDGGNA
ncbi:PQQ-dependent sugar dehydrogenase [Halomonas sp. TD01]|uniref:PQQ-dependent sugar dehydrogenase n=1 Tax=Halomonas sp. TD01 TaxID=999141 RepID=UPI0021B1453E|nr:PQQ-dependent sugar dehydrogenase [Halomonas sp. TD01]